MFVKFLKKIVLCCTLVSFTSSSVSAYIPELFEGADAGIQDLAKQKNVPAPAYILPSTRFMMIETLKNIRFDGNLGTRNKALALPFQMQGLNASDVGVFPLDARSSLLGGCLFPCPDGVILLANQAASDILSQITPAMMGTILRNVQSFTSMAPAARNTQAFKLSIYSLLLGLKTPETVENFQQLSTEHTAFLDHDFDLGLFRFLKNIMGEIYEGALEEGMEEIDTTSLGNTWRAVNEFISSAGGSKTLESRFKKKLGDIPSYDDLEALEEYSENSDTLRKLKQKKNLSPAEKTQQSAFQDKHKVRISLEERRTQFRALGFVETLTRAIQEQDQSSDSSFPYADHMVEQTLMSYFWLKALTQDDVADFYGSLFEVAPAQVKPLFSKTLHRAGYVALKEKMKAGQITDLTPEILSAAARGFDMYENPLPPLLQFKSAHYTPKNSKKSRLAGSTFPDCVETSVRNGVDIHARTKKGDFYESDVSLLKLTPEANAALEGDSLLRFTQAAHDRWGSYLAEIPGVKYLKPANNPERKYELQPGWFNTLRVWAYLLGDRGQELLAVLDAPNDASEDAAPAANASSNNDDDDDNADAEEMDEEAPESPEKLKKAFGVLAGLLSREDHKVEFAIDGDDPDWSAKLSDFTEKVNATINGVKTYIWEQDSSHSSVEYEAIALNDWRKKLSATIPATAGTLALPFLPTSTFEYLSDDLVRERFWGMDFSKREVLLELFDISLKKDTSIWNQIQKVILKHLKELEDGSTENLLAQKVADAVARGVSSFASPRLEAILRVFPKLLSSYVEIKKDKDASQPIEDEKAAQVSNILINGELLRVLNFLNAKNIIPLAQELMKNSSLIVSECEVDVTIMNAIGSFKKLKTLNVAGWKRQCLLDLLPKLPETLKAINFNTEPTTAAEGIEIIKALLERFPKLRISMNVQGKEHLKEVETFIQGLEQKADDQFMMDNRTFA